MSYFDEFQLKTVFRQENTYLIFLLKRKEHINENQLQFLENKSENGLLNVTWTKTGTGNRLVFNISNLVCLSEYIKSEMPQDKFFDIISQFQKIMEFCSNSTMPVNNLLCSLNHIYYDPLSKKIYAAYLPVINSSHSTNIVKFLYDMNKKANVIISNSNVMSKYQEFLEHHMLIQKKCKNKNACFSHNDLYNFLHDIKNTPAQHAAPPAVHKEPERVNSTPAVQEQVKQNFYPVQQNPAYSSDCAFLTDSSGSRYVIDHTPFNIGRNPKSQNIDLSLSSIPEVSGFHASILNENNAFYLQDNNSTNGTFINKKRIKKQQLNDQDQIYIYNIPFTFSCPDAVTRTCIASGAVSQTLCVSSVSPASYAAYIKNIKSGSIVNVASYPFSSDEMDGIVFERHDPDNSIFIKNISCGSLSVENENVAPGEQVCIFSGCSFSVCSSCYTFYIKD
ncbi:MAG: FHA domain-containing protein [Oscillospiraceae bacterium]|nr:FHA domain-containing protein [Oscillospiraceae bacterium]